FAGAAEAAAALDAELAKLPPDLPTVAPSRRTSRLVPRYVRSWWRRNSPIMLAALAALLLLALAAEATRLTAWTALGQRGRLPERVSELPPAAGAEPETPARFGLPAGQGALWSVAFDPCGELIATATEGGAVKLWDIADGHI